MVHAAFVLRALESLFDLSAESCHADQVGDGCLQWGAGEVVGAMSSSLVMLRRANAERRLGSISLDLS
jgi:hypothetical protein